jgi:hypothetical protein
MRAKFLVVVSAIVPVLASCAQDPAPRSSPNPQSAPQAGGASDVLVVVTDGGAVSVRASSGSVLLERAGAIAGPDGSRLYSATRESGATTLETIDATTGTVVVTSRITGAELDVRVASLSGGAVALMEPLPKGVDPWTPVPRARTTIVVADPAGAGEARRYDLTGNFEPEAFSSDDSRLYMIQYLPAEAPTVYRVAALNLRTGAVRAVLGRFKAPSERMPGTRLSQALAPNGNQL